MSSLGSSAYPSNNRRLWLETAIVAVAGLLLFTIGIWDQEFIGFEVRFALFAKEMIAYGPSVFPTSYGEPYPDYPSTSTLLVWLLATLNGQLTKFWAMLPTAIASAATLALTYRLLRDISRRWALLAICFELATVTFLAHARSISLDQMLTAVTLASFYLIYRADTQYPFAPPWPYWLGIWLLITLGFALRGPLGIVIPAGVVNAYLWASALHRKHMPWRLLCLFNISALLWFCLCTAALLYAAGLQGGETFVPEVVSSEIIGRMAGADDDYAAFYFVSSIGNYALSYLPAVLVIVIIAATIIRKKTRDTEMTAVPVLPLAFALWTVIVLVGLSIPQAHKARYILPITPALAALASYPFINDNSHALALLRTTMRATLAAVPGIALLLLFALYYYGKDLTIDLHLHYAWLTTILVIGQLIAIASLFRRRWRPQRDELIFIVTALAFWAVQAWLWEPVKIQRSASRNFVQRAEQQRLQQPAPLVLYRFGKDSLANIYKLYADVHLMPEFAYEPQELGEIAEPCYLVVSDEYARTLRANGAPLPEPLVKGLFYGENYALYFLRDRYSNNITAR